MTGPSSTTFPPRLDTENDAVSPIEDSTHSTADTPPLLEPPATVQERRDGATSASIPTVNEKHSRYPAALQELLRHGARYPFMTAIRYLESLEPDRSQPGRSGPFRAEPIRFRHNPDLTFSSGDISSIEVATDTDGEERIVVEANFLGLTGAVSPAPSYLAEELAQPDDDVQVKRDYLDIFHHRLYGLFYRGIAQYDVPGQIARNEASIWLERLLCTLGFDFSRRRPLQHLRIEQLLRLAPLLASNVRSQKVLETCLNEVLAEYLGDHAHCKIVPFSGHWTQLDTDARVQLGRINHVLGHSTVLGREILHRASKATIEIRGLRESQFRNFIRGGPAYGAMDELLDMLVDDPIDLDVELHIESDGSEGLRLGQSSVGVDAWLSGSTGTRSRQMKLSLQ